MDDRGFGGWKADAASNPPVEGEAHSQSETIGPPKPDPRPRTHGGFVVPDLMNVAPGPEVDFDFSTPEAEAAMLAANALVLEVARPLARKVALYERTLGLAVIPVLLRRAVIDRWRRSRLGRR